MVPKKGIKQTKALSPTPSDDSLLGIMLLKNSKNIPKNSEAKIGI